MISRLRLAASAATIAIIAAAPFSSANAQDEPPILLTMEAPGGGILSDDARIRNGKIKDKDPNLPEESILFEDGYDIYFRLAAPNAEAVHKWRRTFSNNGPSYDVLVLTDPDQCLDLSHTVPSDLFPAFTPMSLEDCNPSNDPDYEPDETFINFHIDQFDAPRVRDSSGGYCRESVRERLVDDEFGAKTPMESNKTYVDPRFTDGAAGIGDVFPVGPNTGGFQSTFDPTNLDHEDCYGFGTDDDLPSLVVMANVGASRIFDDQLVFTDGRIRNMAGLLSGVGFELIDNAEASTIVARMPVQRNMLRTLNFVDLLFSLPASNIPSAGFNVITQNDDVQVTTPVVGATTNEEVVAAILSSFPDEYDVEVRAVVVDGRAPEFIDDVNSDGVFDASDVQAMGYTLISNEESVTLTLLNFEARAIQQDGFECPTSSGVFGSDQQLYVDLDGSNFSGSCQDGDGTSVSGVRRPR